MKPIARRALCVFLLLGSVHPASAAALVATYNFNGTLAPEAGGPTLVALPVSGNPSTFVTTAVPTDFTVANPGGQTSSRTVYFMDGESTSGNQAGFQLDSTGLISATSYSVELVFKFLDQGSYRRILDARTADNGFYVDTTDFLNVYDDDPHAGSTTFDTDTFYHVVLTVQANTVAAYLNGNLELSIASNAMNITASGDILTFFVDEFGGGFSDEYSRTTIALLRVYDGALSSPEVAQLAAAPFSPVPEPSGPVLVLFGVAILALRRR